MNGWLILSLIPPLLMGYWAMTRLDAFLSGEYWGPWWDAEEKAHDEEQF